MLSTMHSFAIAIGALLISTLAFSCVAGRQDPDASTQIDNTSPVIDISPIVASESEGVDPLRLRILNISQRPFRYLGGVGVQGDPKVPALLEIEVFESGKLVKPLLLPGQLGGDEDDIYEIAPGESVDIKVPLSAFYDTFSPGKYRVELTLRLKQEHYLVTHYQLSPIDFNKQVVWLDVK